MQSIGEKIKFIRQEKGLTQSKFGENIGFTKQAVSNVENNLSNPSLDFICKLIVYYNINSNWLIANRGEPYILQNSEDLRKNVLSEIEEILKNYGI